MEINLKITISGNPIVKKNTSKTSLYYKDKLGRRIPRDTPVHFYTEAYRTWAKNAIQTCMIFKTKHPEIAFPISEMLNVRCLFFMKDNHLIDLTNLFQGILDVMSGNEGWANVPSHLYQIIYDDSSRYVASVDGSRILKDVIEPRIEVFLTNYRM